MTGQSSRGCFQASVSSGRTADSLSCSVSAALRSGSCCPRRQAGGPGPGQRRGLCQPTLPALQRHCRVKGRLGKKRWKSLLIKDPLGFKGNTDICLKNSYKFIFSTKEHIVKNKCASPTQLPDLHLPTAEATAVAISYASSRDTLCIEKLMWIYSHDLPIRFPHN